MALVYLICGFANFCFLDGLCHLQEARLRHVPATQIHTNNVPSLFLQRTVGVDTRPDSRHVCEWPGIDCLDGIVWKMRWGYLHFQVGSLDWLPPTLRKVHLKVRRGTKRFHTGRLPRMLRYCLMQSCEILGKIDLRLLPANMEYLNLVYNLISGSLYIDDLPHNISYINLKANPVRFVMVDIRALPTSLFRIDVFFRNTKIKVITVDGISPDNRINTTGEEVPNEKVTFPFDGW